MTTDLTPAERILIGLGIRAPKDIDLEAIAWIKGATIEYEPLDGCEAMIIGSKKKAVILVNGESRPERQRFSIGHEIGHWHHHRGQVLFCGNADIGNPRTGPLSPERQADDFASDLILPNYLFKPLCARIKRLTLATAREIAGEFTASVTATLLRMAKSSCFPIVIVWQNKAGERRAWRGEMVPTWWRLRPDLDKESFAHGLLFEGNAEEKWPRKIEAEAWFDFNGCDRYQVEEQSFWVTSDETVTILTVPNEGL